MHRKIWKYESDSWVIAGILHELFELIQRITDYKLEKNHLYVTLHKISPTWQAIMLRHPSQDWSRIILFTGCVPLNFAFIHLLPPNQGIRLLAVINISSLHHTLHAWFKNILWAYRHETGPWSSLSLDVVWLRRPGFIHNLSCVSLSK